MSNNETPKRSEQAEDARKARRKGWWYLLFVIQFAGILWPPLYNRVEPTLAGIPFFYWYQILWVLVGAGLTAIVYFATEHGRK